MNDMKITVNGTTYRLSGGTAYPVSADTSSEIILRLDKIDSRLDGVESRLDRVETEQKAMRADIQSLGTAIIQLDKEQGITSSRLDDL